MSYTYEYPRPALTVDCVVFGLQQNAALKVLLIRRKLDPFKGDWALPGGFVQISESVDAAAARELKEETGVDNAYLEQLYTFGQPDRDPRERVVSVAYYALVNLSEHTLQAATDASDARWFELSVVPPMGFDHRQILECAIARLRAKIRYEPIGFELLPKMFTLSQLQQLYEQILERDLDKRNFRAKLLKMDLLIDTQQKETGVAHRAAKLYRFDMNKYQSLKRKGFSFDL
ncbi:NUDIX domain-containing protein [cf. Phormidesmis sp. LEGE 11477]|uniref:NUDIX hydrolase n=1 Tax=cf. Phormidesmis sp. LEGE 11477 TaxID=1828680 RepID=UPI00187EA969|nr:NUDIX domain-containing protein [cf. Phormidesmis sp. LEGE 11477]MBE9060840.1 NUDIX hydrolase [cf. Phormidesmis sp. LEGE 11477]